MAVLIHDDEVGLAREQRNDADVRQVAAAEDDGVLCVLESCQARFKVCVERMIAGDQPRGVGPRTVTPCRLEACLNDLGMVRQAEVVIAGERDEFASLAPNAAAVDFLGACERPFEFAALERLQFPRRKLVERWVNQAFSPQSERCDCPEKAAAAATRSPVR